MHCVALYFTALHYIVLYWFLLPIYPPTVALCPVQLDPQYRYTDHQTGPVPNHPGPRPGGGGDIQQAVGVHGDRVPRDQGLHR